MAENEDIYRIVNKFYPMETIDNVSYDRSRLILTLINVEEDEAKKMELTSLLKELDGVDKVIILYTSERKNEKLVKKQWEIDFIVNNGSKRYYIQSAFNVSDPEKMATEIRPLKSTNDFFKKIIITKSSMKPWNDEDGILHLGLYDFLLNEKSLDF